MRTVAIDMDEVLFPFAAGYAAWRERAGLPTFRPDRLDRYDFARSLGDPDQSAQTSAFIDEQSTATIEPLPDAAAVLAQMQRSWRLIVVTNRYATQSAGTLRWLVRWLPGMFDDVIFARPAPGSPGRAKADICREMGAEALGDDTPAHLRNLTSTRAVLFGTYPWQHDIAGLTRARTWAALPAVLDSDVPHPCRADSRSAGPSTSRSTE